MPLSASLQHTSWERKYHVVFLKYRRRSLYGAIGRDLGRIFRALAERKDCRIKEGHVMRDHVHMLIRIPPKYSVSQFFGFIKGKSAIDIAKTYGGKSRNYGGEHFRARGYFVSTAGRGEAVIRNYIRNQEKEEIRLEQLRLFK